ncbi:MAG: hypothetical protein AABY40_01000 [Nanoarchaeota archaeon]
MVPKKRSVKIMEYLIHGRKVNFDEIECGIYKQVSSGLKIDYAVMDIDHLVQVINGLPVDAAVEAVTELKDLAARQSRWEHTPQNGVPGILRYNGPDPAPIEKVRGNIENTLRFSEEILKALKGQ